ncbi:unnamed protein product [Cylindrotheca closterium]|uniref:sphingolipid C(9)-methyltransferase n=1 Tax=Cylindrotheca closterium TaxID=2856 RepID=A0AAD2CDL7_9STRA|nr:unnamed protein product [Cylindrotheca closterium]
MKITNPTGIDIFEVILFKVEFLPHLVTFLTLLWYFIPSSSNDISNISSDISNVTKGAKPARKWVTLKLFVLLYIPLCIVVMAATTFAVSWEDAYMRGYDIFSQPSLRPMLEAYIETGDGDLTDILESNKYAPTLGVYEIRYLFKDLLRHTLLHSNDHNEDNIDEGYNKGNDWFRYFLGETMMYTSGLYPTGKESLTEAQNYKIDYVADAIQVQPGDSVLDIGCGWSYLARRLAEEHGANVTGITLSKEQRQYFLDLDFQNKVTILLQDAMRLKERNDLPIGGFDKITSLEMAEHVGIRRYQEFLKHVHSLLKDDGVFYFQVAGLRRAWRFEDLVWGLFMGEHVFPGADASCPLGWVSTQVERAGFEIQRVHNMGTHYSRTIDHWLENWRSNQQEVEQKFGAAAYRRWEVFLAWSVRVARQGSSTLFMLTLTKAGQEARRIESQMNVVPKYVQYKPEF